MVIGVLILTLGLVVILQKLRKHPPEETTTATGGLQEESSRSDRDLRKNGTGPDKAPTTKSLRERKHGQDGRLEPTSPLGQFKKRNRQDLEHRLAFLREHFDINEPQEKELRSQMIEWFRKQELIYEQNPAGVDESVRESVWRSLCEPVLAGPDQAPVMRELEALSTRQFDRNARYAGEFLVEALKDKQPPANVRAVAYLLTNYQTYQQGWATNDPQRMPWAQGVESGYFTPLETLLDAEQLEAVMNLLRSDWQPPENPDAPAE